MRSEVRSPFCIRCNNQFGNYLKYHSKDRCNPCYQKDYALNKDSGGIKDGPKKLKETNCKVCKV